MLLDPGTIRHSLGINLFNILRDRQLTPDPHCVGADSGLHPNAVDCHLKMLTPMPDKDLHKMPLHTFVQTVLRHKQLVSSRQSAEWGMRIIQGCWSRLHLPLPVDNHKRQQILTCCIALHNLRTRRVGLNQIKTVYQDHWKVAMFGAPDAENCRVERHYYDANFL